MTRARLMVAARCGERGRRDAGQASPIGAINSTIVAGELATEQASTLLTEVLKSKKADLRYQAAMGIRRTFEAMQTTVPAVGEDRARPCFASWIGGSRKKRIRWCSTRWFVRGLRRRS